MSPHDITLHDLNGLCWPIHRYKPTGPDPGPGSTWQMLSEKGLPGARLLLHARAAT